MMCFGKIFLSLMDSLVDSGDEGDSSHPVVPAAPAATSHHPQPRTSHQKVPAAAGEVPPSVGLPLVVADAADMRQGFLCSKLPRALCLDPKQLPEPFSAPGDALLQFVLENFNSLVCIPIAPRSKLFVPSPVHIALRSESNAPVSRSSVLSLLQYWIGSKF
jgi:hypothetical protein